MSNTLFHELRPETAGKHSVDSGGLRFYFHQVWRNSGKAPDGFCDFFHLSLSGCSKTCLTACFFIFYKESRCNIRFVCVLTRASDCLLGGVISNDRFEEFYRILPGRLLQYALWRFLSFCLFGFEQD